MFVVVLVMVIVTAFISWSWVNGIDYMKENHPDYTGDDFLNCGEDECITKMAGRDAWDDNAINSEGDF
jgi:hypothetical protein